MSRLVYFSSVSNNTQRFAERLDEASVRIPLRPRIEPMISVDEPYVLMLPTYGGGAVRTAVPKQVLAFLKHDPAHRELVRGIISSGNTNFGTAYCLASRVLSSKLAVPELYRFELLGTPEDTRKVNAGLARFWTTGQAEEIAITRAAHIAARTRQRALAG
ncbi:class Ib ribonucleoside-diphosphate reductase assembly flavoprotein NrdI [Brevibacterium luteolum]|uniref:class Ib ribonucleoside-diphosphate reductase assembly flavoprotein NrdI n=1 Tax=Brevibacterium luteolum TaxID=199591 RepID=UPI001C20FF38|nr:class Ib ribonucleoside-diphosphate reductase assembly flavoprotein NrdI [Brevibacterium luteolum]